MESCVDDGDEWTDMLMVLIMVLMFMLMIMVGDYRDEWYIYDGDYGNMSLQLFTAVHKPDLNCCW